MAESSQPADPRFQYQNITRVAITEDDLHLIARAVFDPNATKNYFYAVFALIRMALAALYLIALERLSAIQAQITKQKYEQQQDAQAQGQVNQAVQGLDTQKETKK